jgi:hypothetical protein
VQLGDVHCTAWGLSGLPRMPRGGPYQVPEGHKAAMLGCTAVVPNRVRHPALCTDASDSTTKISRTVTVTLPRGCRLYLVHSGPSRNCIVGKEGCLPTPHTTSSAYQSLADAYMLVTGKRHRLTVLFPDRSVPPACCAVHVTMCRASTAARSNRRVIKFIAGV